MDTEHSAITEPVRRLEVFTGAGRRRTWRDQDKARIVAEIATSGDSACAVGRRHGLSPQQLFGWRRQLRESEAGRSEADELQFVPAVVDAGSSAVPQRRMPRGKGIFRWPKIENDVMKLSAAQLSDWRRVHEAQETVTPTQPAGRTFGAGSMSSLYLV